METDKKDITINKKIIDGLMETIRNLYRADDIPWAVSYSGGKDSTATLQLVWMALEALPREELTKQVYIINTDTLVESPVISRWVQNSLNYMNHAAALAGLPFSTHCLTPEPDQTFWVNLLGRGYPFPRKIMRWCTDRLKIHPINQFIMDQIAKYGEVIMVLGTRKAESARRAKTMAYYEKKRVRELLSPNPSLLNELIFSPLEDWTNQDVWVFLMQYKNPWGYSNQALLSLYRGATEDEDCPLMIEKDLPNCGKSRFGCWVCTMVEQDKSMQAMIANDEDKIWMQPLLDFRNRFGDETHDRERRSFRKMNGSLQGSYKQLNHGPYQKEFREQWLKELLQIQTEIHKNGPEEFCNLELITLEELRSIRRIWVLDKHEFDDSLPRIYQEVTGKKFDDPEWIGSKTFGCEEWDILKDVVSELFPEEELAFEMAYSLIDIENRWNGISRRNEVVKELESCIQHTFYKNEADAAQYYFSQIERKKDFGGKYNEKILDDSYEQMELADLTHPAEKEESISCVLEN